MENTDHEEEMHDPERKPGSYYLLQFFGFIGLAFMGAFVFQAIALLVLRNYTEYPYIDDPLTFFSNPENVKYFWFYQGIATLGFFAFPCLVFPLYLRERPMEYLGLRDMPRLSVLGLAVLLVIFAEPVIGWLAQMNSRLKLPEALSGLETQLARMHKSRVDLQNAVTTQNDTLNIILSFVVMAVLPAILEELFFRKVLLRIFYEVSGRAHVSVWAGAFLFSLSHMEVYYFLPLMVMGALMGYLLLYTGNIWIPIAAHFINNSIAVIAKRVSAEYPEREILQESYEFSPLLILLSFAAVILLIWLIKRIAQNQTDNGKRLD